MIARITGRLNEVAGGSVLIDTGGGLCYEVLVPACDLERHTRRLGQEIVLHTIHYMEGDPARGNLIPRLVGFSSQTDRDFFRVFTTVKGIGIRKALRALARSPADVASIIANKDAKGLMALPEIGKRLSEQIIAELSGRVDQFAGPAGGPDRPELPEPAMEALMVLVQLGERRTDAVALIERVLAVAPELTSPEAIIQQVYKLKAGGK